MTTMTHMTKKMELENVWSKTGKNGPLECSCIWERISLCFKWFLTFPSFKTCFIEGPKYVSFDIKALRLKIVVFCSVIPYSLVDANISQKPAATTVMVQEIEHFYCTCPSCYIVLGYLTIYSLLLTWCTNSLTFNNCALCPHCIYGFCIYLRTNRDLCHLQPKLIGFYNRDEKCLQRGTDWVFK